MSTAAASVTVTGITNFSGGNPLTLPNNTSGSIDFNVEDLNTNPMAAGTTIRVMADSAIGTISGPGASWTIGCRTASGLPANGGGENLSVTLKATATAGASGNITITVTSPGTKTNTVFVIPVTFNLSLIGDMRT